MTLKKRKQVEDKISTILEDLTKGEQAILYKTLYALGFKIADCDEIIRTEPAPSSTQEEKSDPPRVTPQVYLPRGWPSLKTS